MIYKRDLPTHVAMSGRNMTWSCCTIPLSIWMTRSRFGLVFTAAGGQWLAADTDTARGFRGLEKVSDELVRARPSAAPLFAHEQKHAFCLLSDAGSSWTWRSVIRLSLSLYTVNCILVTLLRCAALAKSHLLQVTNHPIRAKGPTPERDSQGDQGVFYIRKAILKHGQQTASG